MLWGVTVDEGFLELEGIRLQRVDVVGKDDYLVAALFMMVDEKLAGLKSGWLARPAAAGGWRTDLRGFMM